MWTLTVADGILMQLSMHTCPKSLYRELPTLLPDATLTSNDHITVIPTIQKTSCNLLDVNQETDNAKDMHLEVFIQWGKKVRQNVEELAEGEQFWVEIIDPCSGYPVFGSRGSGIYSEVEGFQRLLRYSCEQVGMCKVLVHPVWGANIYPATMFSNAPQHILLKACNIHS